MRGRLLLLMVAAAALLALGSAPPGELSATGQNPIVGDADCNHAVNPDDSLDVLVAVADAGSDPECMEYADTNCDQVVDARDVLEMLRFSADVGPGNLPDDCSQVGWAVGLPPLDFEVDESIPVSGDIAGIGGGPPRSLEAIEDDSGARSLFVAEELVLVTDSTAELNAFLARRNGTLLRSIDPSSANIHNVPSIHLVRVENAADVNTGDLPNDLRELSQYSWGELAMSSQEAMGLLAIAADEAAAGTDIDLNWVAEGATLDNREIAEASSGPSQWSPNPFDWAYMKRGGNQDIGVADAWRALKAAGQLDNDVKIAILDGGFAPNADFPAGYEMNGPVNTPNPASCTAGSACPWHGTVVTASAMGVIDNGFGVAGSAGPVADGVLTQSPSLDIFEILEYIFISLPSTSYPLPTVLNISAGFGIPREVCLTGICLLMDGISSGVRALDVLMFAAAGNDSKNVDAERCIDLLLGEICYEKTTHIPCELAYVICVGGLDWDSSSRRSASNYGTDGDVEIFGPMVQFATPTPESGITRDSCGTSCASPFVAGVAALIKAADPGLSAGGIEDILLSTAHHSTPDPTVSRWVNAYNAVITTLGGNEPPELDVQNSDWSGPGGLPMSFTALVTDPEDRPFLGDPYVGWPAVQWTSSLDGVIATGPNPAPVTLSYGTHVITATATDTGGLSVQESLTLTLINYPPSVNIISPASGASFGQGVQVQLVGQSVDQNRQSTSLNNDEVQWFRALQSNPVIRTPIGTGHQLTTTFNQGNYIITFVGTDEGGMSDEASINLTIGPPPQNFPPNVTITAPTPPQPGQGYCPTPNPPDWPGVTFTGNAVDPEGDPFSLVWYQLYNGQYTQLGTGPSIVVTSFPGVPANTPFQVILRATDSHNNVGEAAMYMEWVCFV